MTEGSPEQDRVSIWIWVGLVLTTFGLLILGKGLLSLSEPPPTVLGHLHPRVWWGALMSAVGVIFVVADLRASRGQNRG